MITYSPAAVGKTADRDSAVGRLRQATAPSTGRLSRLRALVVLSGVVRAKGWISELGRSVLDLPIAPGRTLLVQWFEQAIRLSAIAGSERLAMEVLVDRVSPLPTSGDLPAVLPANGLNEFRVERDPVDYRGTGGVLRDLSLRYQDDDYLLVATGAQVLTGSLEEQAALLASRTADVAIVGHDDGTPAALFWVRCGCLRTISELGYVDLKEQALPQIARDHQVKVVMTPPVGTPLRTPAEYLRAVRQYHRYKRSGERAWSAFAEDWQSAFSIIEDGAEVDPSAQVLDSVVLKGARVGRNAVVVRSLVGPAGSVPHGQRVIDRFVNGASRRRD